MVHLTHMLGYVLVVCMFINGESSVACDVKLSASAPSVIFCQLKYTS